MKTSKLISVGFAMFAMLFGAGNVIYPLSLGRDIGHMLWVGLAGFVITAIFVPLLGLVSTMLCDGQYSKFLGRLGKIPGAIIAMICMILIGPFALTPRCIDVSHASIKLYLPWFSLPYFSVFSAVLILLFTLRKNQVVDLLGRYLGPLKVVLLSTIIIKGILYPSAFIDVTMSVSKSFALGFGTGYATADLLGTVFFSGLILSGLKQGLEGTITPKLLAIMGLKAGVFGGLLLGVMYTGFCVVAAFNGASLQGVPDGDIFSILAELILGHSGGLFANITVAISCLTTAIALTTVFADYLQREILMGRVSYHICLLITISITTFMSNLGFDAIMGIIMPCVEILYPALIMLSIVNGANILFGFRWIKTPVFATLSLSILLKYTSLLTPFIPDGLI